MKPIEIKSHSEFAGYLGKHNRLYILLYKKGSEQSECSLKNLKSAADSQANVTILLADVNQVRDIHEKYSVTAVPAMLEFENGKFINVLKGCHEPGFYKSLFDNLIYKAKLAENAGKPQKRVTVYSTPTCSWCTTLKTHLKRNGIRYTDMDVSGNQQAAAEMQRKSGQMGVPQIDIDGQMIVGFDKTRINNLLGIGAEK